MSNQHNHVTQSWTGGGGSFGILVHGGAGKISPARQAAHAEGCKRAALAGHEILKRGGSSLDAVQAAVELLEDDPAYNSGTGGSLNEIGELRLDASTMFGGDLRSGAVCDMTPFRHPIAIARQVLEANKTVLYSAEGAAKFAKEHGFEPVTDGSMITDLARLRLAETMQGASANWAGGTVGAVAFDSHGHVSSATSTGGMMGKPIGRVGDSPIVGAGTYADDAGAAISCTGEGEAFVRLCIAFRASLWVEQGMPVTETAMRAIQMVFDRTGSRGGLIVASPQGLLGFARSTETMSWGAAWDGGSAVCGV
jgi:L-asparaginase / beta-aspartyl-peptidase